MTRGTLHFVALVVALSTVIAASLGAIALAPAFGARADGCGCTLSASTATPWVVGGLGGAVLTWLGLAAVRVYLRTRAFARCESAVGAVRSAGQTAPFAIIPQSERAFCVGLWRPRILVGERLRARLSSSELSAVIAHEAAHARRRDPLRLFIVETIASALGPLGRPLAERFRLDVELDADEAAVAAHGRADVARAFLALLESPHQPGTVAVPFLSVTESRALQLLEARPRAFPLVPALLAVVAVVALGFGLRSTARAIEQPPVQAAQCRRASICPRPELQRSPRPRTTCITTPSGTLCLESRAVQVMSQP